MVWPFSSNDKGYIKVPDPTCMRRLAKTKRAYLDDLQAGRIAHLTKKVLKDISKEIEARANDGYCFLRYRVGTIGRNNDERKEISNMVIKALNEIGYEAGSGTWVGTEIIVSWGGKEK